jgi:site-specific recombinase XerD
MAIIVDSLISLTCKKSIFSRVEYGMSAFDANASKVVLCNLRIFFETLFTNTELFIAELYHPPIIFTLRHTRRIIIIEVINMNKKRPSEFLTPQEATALLRCPDTRTLQGKRDKALLMLMLTTGLRKAEVCALKVKSIVSWNNTKAIQVEYGKGGKDRIIPLRPDCLRMITDYWKKEGNGNNTNNPMFMTLGKHYPCKVKPLTRKAIDKIIIKYKKESLITKRMSPHTLRHTFATGLLQKGADLKTVKELMGHAYSSTTELYLHTTDERKAQAVLRLAFGG